MILSAIAEKLKRRSKDDFKGRHFEASLILQAVSCICAVRLGISVIHRAAYAKQTACEWATERIVCLG